MRGWRERMWLAVASLVGVALCLTGGAAASQGMTAAPTPFMVGAAVRDVTPTPEMLPLSRAPKVQITGVVDPLHVRVIALSRGSTTALIVSTETGKGPYGPQFAEAVARRTGIPVDAVFYTATHSHAAPEITERIDLLFEAGTPVTNLQRWGRLVMDRMLDAAVDAMAHRRPASVGIGYAKSYINVNRLAPYTKVVDGKTVDYRDFGFDPDGYTDKTLAAIRFNDVAGKPIAFVVDYPVHGTVMHDNTLDHGHTAISSDLPGYVSSSLEAEYPGSVALWLSGAAGDQNPLIQNDMYSRNPLTGVMEEKRLGDYDMLTYLGRINVADTERAIAGITAYQHDPRISYGLVSATIPAKAGGSYPVSLQMLRIGDIALVGFPGELFSKIGLDLKAASPLPDTLIVNHVWQREQQKTGYHADDRSIARGGFGTTAQYKVGTLTPELIAVERQLVRETAEWTPNGDGTATNRSGRTAIVGLDGLPATGDDDRLVNPAGKVLRDHVRLSVDAQGRRYIALGNGFDLYAGADGKLGTQDDVVRGFGRFPQDADGAVRPLDWRLLDLAGDTAVLASASILDAVVFDPGDASADWAPSNLRAWLNSSGGHDAGGDAKGFLASAFTDGERARIRMTDVPMASTKEFVAYDRNNPDGDHWHQYRTVGAPARDRVWALSGEEVFGWFGYSTRDLKTVDTNARQDPRTLFTNAYLTPTVWAEAHGVKINEGHNGAPFVGYGDSWTRSAGAPFDGKSRFGVFLGSTGSLNSGREVTKAYGALPAITVSLSGGR